MKRLLIPFAVLPVLLLAGCKSPWAQADEVNSLSNLRQIGYACKTYAGDHKGQYPADLNSLFRGGYLSDARCFISPRDTVRKTAADNAELLPENCSYVYTGAGLVEEKNNRHVPIAF